MRNIILLFSIIALTTSCSTKSEDTTSLKDEKKDSSIKFSGSDTEKKLVSSLVEGFQKKHPDFNAEVSGGGSQLGIENFIAGKIDVLNSSRQMESYELKRAQKNNVTPIPAIFAVDAVAFVTNPYLGVDSLSIFDLGKIYRGEVTNWKEVGGPDREIVLYGRDINSGTYSYVWQRIVQEEYAKTMNEMKGNGDIIEAVKKDTNGIGYVGVGYIMDTTGMPSREVWAINVYIEGDCSYSPYEIEAIKSGDYPMVRPLFHYFKGEPKEELAQYLEFILSDEGQKIVRKSNYFPISENYQIFNKLKGNTGPGGIPNLIGLNK